MKRIVIAGAGPVGLSLAMGLVRNQVPVTVLEAEPQLTKVPKASTIHPPSLEIFAEWGVLEQVESMGLIVDKFQYWDRRRNRLIAEFDLSVLKAETIYPYRVQCEQHNLTSIFYEHLRRSGLADIRFGHTVVDVRQEGDVVRVGYETAGELKWMECDVLAAADGARSRIRKTLGIEFEGFTYPNPYQLIVVDCDMTKAYPNLAPVSYFFDPDEWVALIQGIGVWKMLIPLEDESESKPDILYEKVRRFAKTDEPFNIVYTTMYRAHQRVAARFVQGRVVLIGDAAHVNTPLGGMGMNSGIHDAYFLARTLTAMYRGEAGYEALLEFERKRKYVIHEFVQRHTIRNADRAGYRDEEATRKERLEQTAADPELARAYVLKTSMIEGFRMMQTV